MVYVIVGLIVVLILLILISINEDHVLGFIYGVFAGVDIMILSFCIVTCVADRIPTAMDVYNGKTTLEITYRDGMAVDSTVVFKDEFLKEENK